MLSRGVTRRIALSLILSLASPLLLNYLIGIWSGPRTWEHEPLHSMVETLGAAIAIGVAAMLLMRLRHENSHCHLIWVASALLVMGMLDGLHATMHLSFRGGWVRSIATLIGGVFFCLIWLPESSTLRALRWMAKASLILGTALCLALFFYGDRLPKVFDASGFTFPVKVVNVVGGVLFLVAAAWFLKRYAAYENHEDLIFANHCLLFGVASVLFATSLIWQGGWWFFHGLRLLAYFVVIRTAWDIFERMHRRIQRHNLALESQVEERTRQLRKSEERYRAFITQSSEAIWRFEFEEPVRVDSTHEEQLHRAFRFGYLAECNDAMAQMYGLKSADEIIGKRLTEFMQPSDPQNAEFLTKFLTSGYRLVDAESVEVGPNGEPLRFLNNLVGTVENGVLTRVWGTQRDITERKRAEEALRDSEEQLNAIIQNTSAAIYLVSADSRFLHVNRRFEELFDVKNDEVRGKTLSEVFPQSIAVLMEKNNRRVVTERAAIEFEEVAPHPDGLRTYSSIKSPLFDSNGKVRSVVGVSADITARKRAEEALQEAQARLARHAEELEKKVAERTVKLRESIAELESFSYSLSHDMRAPLRAIQSFTQIVLEESGPAMGENGVGLLQRVVSAAERMDRLILDVLAFSRVSRQEMTLVVVDVESLLRGIIHERPEFRDPNAIVTVESPLLPLLGHEASLTQCITNLLSNAVKFVAAGVKPRVRIWTESIDGRVRLWFEDNGIGMEKDAQSRLFQMFNRIHGGHSYEGTGIGLAIVRKAVERMGGEAGVISEPGRGSRFWLQLQAAPTRRERG